MFDNAINNILLCDLNTIGLVLGFIGALIVTIFGLPSISLLNDGSVFEITLTARMKRNIWFSRAGLLMLSIGFVCQLAAVQ